MEVVCALIKKKQKLLLCQRPLHKAKSGLWEFPGGKIEPGESGPQALTRELYEELNISLTNLMFFASVIEGNLTLHCYGASFNGWALPREHLSLAWVEWRDIDSFNLCPGDKKFLDSKHKIVKKWLISQ